MPRRVAACLALLTLSCCLAGCRERAALERAVDPAAQVQAATATREMKSSAKSQTERGQTLGSTRQQTTPGHAAQWQVAPAAAPGDPPHIIAGSAKMRPGHLPTSRMCVSLPMAPLERELPRDFVRVWVMQDDAQTPVDSYEARVSGPAAAGVLHRWFRPRFRVFYLGNPRRGKLVVDVRARGFDDVSRQVTLLPRKQRRQAVRQLCVQRPSGPDVVLRMGPVVRRCLDICGQDPPPTPTRLEIDWRGEGVHRTRSVLLPGRKQQPTSHLALEVPSGARHVSVRPAAVWVATAMDLGPRDVRSDLGLRHPDPPVLRGRVVTPDGGKPTSAKVLLKNETTGSAVTLPCERDGGFHIHGYPAGRLRLEASALGYGKSKPVRLRYDGDSDVDVPAIVLSPPGRLEVVVTGAGRRLTQWVTVRTYGRGSGMPDGHLGVPGAVATKPAEDGTYPIAGLTPGKRKIVVEAPCFDELETVVDIHSGRTTAVAATLAPHPSVWAKLLRPDGTPAANTEVSYECTYWAVGPPEPMQRTRTGSGKTDEDGTLPVDFYARPILSLRVTTECGRGYADGLDKASAAGIGVVTIRLRP